jgi:hypothetical protein
VTNPLILSEWELWACQMKAFASTVWMLPSSQQRSNKLLEDGEIDG